MHASLHSPLSVQRKLYCQQKHYNNLLEAQKLLPKPEVNAYLVCD